MSATCSHLENHICGRRHQHILMVTTVITCETLLVFIL